MNGLLPIFGGLVLTLISFRVIGAKRQMADPDLESAWDDSLRLMRFGGPALILIGAAIVIHVLKTY